MRGERSRATGLRDPSGHGLIHGWADHTGRHRLGDHCRGALLRR